MQPLVSSTIFSTAERPVTTRPSIPISPISFMMTATGLPRSPWSRTCRRSVVFPLPRKPVRMSTATPGMSASAEGTSREPFGDRLAEQPEQGRRHVVDGDLREKAPQRGLATGGREDEYPLPVMVRLVGAGVVLEGVDSPHPDGADGPPVEVAEIHDQIRRYAVDGAEEVFGTVCLRADYAPLRIGDRLDAGDQVRAHAFVIPRLYRAGGLAPADVHEEPTVVATVTPGSGARPVDRHAADRGRLGGRGGECQVPFAPQPLVEADAPIHLLRAVIGDDEHQRLGRAEGEHLAELPIDVTVVVENGGFEGVTRFVLVVGRIHVAPEPMVDAVDTHLDQHEEVPAPGTEHVLRQPEVLVGLLVDAPQEGFLVRRPEVLDVEDIASRHALDLRLESGRMGVGALGRRGEKAGDHLSMDGRGRVRLRHPQDDAVQSGFPEPVPEARH